MSDRIEKAFVVFKKDCVQTCENIKRCVTTRIIVDNIIEFKEFLRREHGYDHAVIEIDMTDRDSLIRLHVPFVSLKNIPINYHRSMVYGVIKYNDGLVEIFQTLHPSKQTKEFMDQLFTKYFKKE